MPDQYDDFEVRNIVENEGIGYAVLHYMGAESVENPATAKLWEDAAKALKALSDRLHLDE